MIGQQQKVIDNLTFIVDPFGAMTSLTLKAELVRLFGGAFASLIGTNKGDIMDSEVDIVQAIEKLTSVLDEETLIKLVNKILLRSNVIFEDSPQMKPLSNEVNFNKAFMQNLMTLYKVIWFVLEVNYSSFLEQIGGFGLVKETLTPKKPIQSVKKSSKDSVK